MRARSLVVLAVLAPSLAGCPALLSDDFVISQDAAAIKAVVDATPSESDEQQPGGDAAIGDADVPSDGTISVMTSQDATASQDASPLPDVVIAPPPDAASCMATQTVTAPAYCPTMGAYSIPAHLVHAGHGGGQLICSWQATPAECACDYSCACILAAYANTPCVWQCAMNTNGLLTVYCMGDGPP